MTFTKLMLNKFPNGNLNNLMIDCCPCNFGYRTIGTEIVRIIGSCFIECKVCWNSEIVNDDENIIIEKNKINITKNTKL